MTEVMAPPVAPGPEAKAMHEEPVVEGEQLSLDPQIAENEAAEREIARTGIKTELRGFSYDQVTSDKPWQNLSEEHQTIFADLAREDNHKLFARNEDKAQARFLRKIQSEMSAERLAESRAKRQAAKAERAEAKRATLEDLEPKERFSRLRSSYKSLKAVYQERRARKAEASQDSETQTITEETPDSRLDELIAKGMEEQTANTIIDVADKIAANRGNMERTDKQKHRYALDVTRRAVLGEFNVAKLADSQEAKEALIALRKEVSFLLDGEEATEPAELSVLVAEQQAAIEAEVVESEKRNRAREIGVAAMAATIGLTGIGVVTAETLGDRSPAAAIEMADETDQADNNTFTTSEGTFRMGSMDAVAPPAGLLADNVVDEAVSPLKAAVAEANDTAPGAVSSAGEQAAPVAAEQQLAGEHIVEEGDNLWNIVEKQLGPDASNAEIASEVQRLAELNDLADPDLIYPGQVIKS